MNKIIYVENSEGVCQESYLEEYIGASGVWALYGIEKSSGQEKCLNVGKSVDVGEEILYDIGCMHFLPVRKDGDTKYINQFKEDCGFYYKKGQTVEYLYPEITEKYHSLKFVLIYDKTDKDKESSYAKQEHACYWRNGGAFREKTKIVNLKEQVKQRIGDLFQDGGETYTCDELIYTICSEFGYEKSWAVRILNEMIGENHLIECSNKCYTR